MHDCIRRRLQQERRYQPGKACAGPQVRPTSDVRRDGVNLRRISEMPQPYVAERRRGDQISRRLPATQQGLIDLKLRFNRFKFREETERLFPARSVSHARRARAASSVNAECVMPSIRCAWPIVRGRK